VSQLDRHHDGLIQCSQFFGKAHLFRRKRPIGVGKTGGTTSTRKLSWVRSTVSTIFVNWSGHFMPPVPDIFKPAIKASSLRPRPEASSGGNRRRCKHVPRGG
jgi:hypothetical protein